MKTEVVDLTYEVELQPGERLTLPVPLLDGLGAGRWMITIQPVSEVTASVPIRRHDAFLSGYAEEDEGLYDDYPAPVLI